MPKPGVPAVCVAEGIATFILCLVAAGTIVTDATFDIGGLPVIALATGLALSAAITASINVSGAHLNPAVTLVLLATGRIAAPRAAAYVAAQLAGATAAAAAITAIFSGVPGAPRRSRRRDWARRCPDRACRPGPPWSPRW